jgi:hypothetical protein
MCTFIACWIVTNLLTLYLLSGSIDFAEGIKFQILYEMLGPKPSKNPKKSSGQMTHSEWLKSLHL